MINARKILRDFREFQEYPVDCGNIPQEVMRQCLCMYRAQNCQRGHKNFAMWLYECYNNANSGTKSMIGNMLDAMDVHNVGYIDDNAVIQLLRIRANDEPIDIEQLILELDEIYDEDGQLAMDYMDTTIMRWIRVTALGKSALKNRTAFTPADSECTGYEERLVTYAAAQALHEVDGMHYLDGEHVRDGLIKIAVDTRYLNEHFSGQYERIIAPYADCKKWNNQNPPELWIQFISYDAETGLCEAVKPSECNIETNASYNAAYASKRQQKQAGSRDITPPIIDAADLNMEIPECLLN